MAKIENVGNDNVDDKNNKAEEHADFSQQQQRQREEEASEQVGPSKTREEMEEELNWTVKR